MVKFRLEVMEFTKQYGVEATGLVMKLDMFCKEIRKREKKLRREHFYPKLPGDLNQIDSISRE